MPEMDFKEFGYAKNRVAHRLYISKSFKYPGKETAFRYGYKRFEAGPLKELVRIGDEFVLHETDKGIQQIRAKFLEDGRGVTHLHIQRWSTKTENPMGEQVVLYGEQISKLLEFLESIRRLEIPGPDKFNVNEADLRLVHMPDDEANKLFADRPDLVAEFARSQITTEDVVALAYRREQLKCFSDMLDNAEDIPESSWQDFFERNQWIFGYGLSYIFTTGLDGLALQQTIRGSSLVAPGKIPDGIMKTRAAVSALCLVEIKKSSTRLLKRNEYRSGTWVPSAELSGAVAQCQETLRTATDTLDTYHRFSDEHGDLTGEELMSVQPRSFLVIGSLEEFQSDHGVNASRYQSFEGFRRNLLQPEVLTFDELYERAHFIVDHTENSGMSTKDDDLEEIPF
jgi:hypothetical protein